MKFYKRLSLILKSLVVLVTTLVLIVGLLDFIDITITSEKARRVLLEQIKTITNRDTRIDGEVQITVSLVPKILVERIHIKNTEGFGEEDFITVSEVRVEFALLPLLTGDFHLEELSADHAYVGLIQNKDGSYNWSFERLIKLDDAAIKATRESAKKESKSKKLSLGVFKLTDISIKYTDESDDQVIEGHLERLIVNLKDSTKPQAEISGILHGSAYDMAFESDAFQKFTSGEVWEMHGTGKIANRKTNFNYLLQLNEKVIEGNVDVNVQNINMGAVLEKLGIISEQDITSKYLNINIKLKGEDATELYQKADIELSLGKGYWKLASAKDDQTKNLLFNKIILTTSLDKPVELHLDGSVLDEDININLKTNSLREFIDEVEKIDVNLEAHVAGSDITTKGTLDLPVKTKQFKLDISIKGKDLEKLNKIFSSELPPFNNYSLTGNVSANERGFIIKSDDATIGDTHFKTVIVIDTSSFKPFWTINLNSRQLQIKDFEFAESKIEIPDAETIRSSLKQVGGESGKDPGRHLKKIVDDPRMHFDLNLYVENVLVGESSFGSSSLSLKLRENTLIMDKAEFNVPGGHINSTAAFKVEDKQVKGAFKLYIDKFEYGAVVRYMKPGSPQGGVISTKIDIKMGGKDFSRLFDTATGKLDLAIWPRNTKTGVFDLWATNLFLLILPEIRKKESKVNCLVALMDLNDGVMKEDFFGLDSTKVWMFGNFNVDFKKESVSLSLYPNSKTAKFFAVQAPIRAEGNFNNIRLVTNPIDVTVGYLYFITSPLHVPVRWVFEDKVPEDASEACERFFDREYVKELKAKLDAEEQKEIDEWLDSD